MKKGSNTASKIEPIRKNIQESGWRELAEELSWIETDRFEELRESRLRAISAGEELLDLSMINPDLPPPRFCLDKLSEFLLKPQNHRYSVARGIRKLRLAFAAKYQRKFYVELSAEDNVCVTAGTKDALMHILRIVAPPGSKVLLPSPTYPLYQSAVKLNGLSASFFKIAADEDSTLENLISALVESEAKVLLLNFPNNPTGMLVSKRFYEKLFLAVKKYDVFVINDFVYGELGFPGSNPQSILSVDGFINYAVETYSLSKAYSIPGWRIGAVMGNPLVIKRVASLKTHSDYGSFLPLQYAAAASLSLSSDLVAPQLQQYQLRCDTLTQGLSRLGFDVSRPNAGACVWARLPASYPGENTSVDFALECMDRFRVMISPGAVFGREYSRHIRLAAVLPQDELGAIVEKFSFLVAEV